MAICKRIEEYLEYCKYRKELDEKTLKAYKIDLKQFFTTVSRNNPQKNEIEQYITELHKTYKQKTVKRKIASIKAFYNYLEGQDLIDINPFRKINVKFKETVILPRIIPRAEIEHLLNYMYSCHRNTKRTGNNYILRDIAIVEVFFATGARVYEISNIRADCVDLESGSVRIMGKGGRERYIQIVDEDVLGILKQYYSQNKEMIKKSGYFFINQLGRRFSEQSVRNMLKKYTKHAGLDRNITPHMFRHSFATYLIEEGVDISYVQHILGHSSIKTTQIYIHIASKKQAEILKDMHPRKQMCINAAA
ncbi:hypothetical protein C818_02600 [Lachnospiraceae bacterium MD308]|nr:hypothetical protein C818_02597 [Lachnospiraceae bacterium MD308]EOS69449.1 hypothetical protein C818_02600 [Lachnospiraceae bacterium MD308]